MGIAEQLDRPTTTYASFSLKQANRFKSSQSIHLPNEINSTITNTD